MTNQQKNQFIKEVSTAVGKSVAAEFKQIDGVKKFELHVQNIARMEYSGDTVKARAAILSNRTKYPDAWKSYEASRQVKHS
jgi:hypothetical protein